MAQLTPVKDILCPLGTEWRPWTVWRPPAVVIQIAYPEYGIEPWTIDPSLFPDIDSWTDEMKNGLYWRLTGIGKQRIEGLDR